MSPKKAIGAVQRIATTIMLPIVASCHSLGDAQWVEVFSGDDGGEAWTRQWFLEGDQASVVATEAGIVFSAGPTVNDPSSHAVLWTQQSFSGDIRIEYDYTRLDSMTDETSVNILYIHATGIGESNSPTDIKESSHLRRIPFMRSYFLTMNLLHISYATTGPIRSLYVSARPYPALSVETFNESTLITPVYEDVRLFAPGHTYHITVTKLGNQLRLVAERGGRAKTFEWTIPDNPLIESGRIGFRHMWGRSSKYENIRIFARSSST